MKLGFYPNLIVRRCIESPDPSRRLAASQRQYAQRRLPGEMGGYNP